MKSNVLSKPCSFSVSISEIDVYRVGIFRTITVVSVWDAVGLAVVVGEAASSLDDEDCRLNRVSGMYTLHEALYHKNATAKERIRM